MKTSSKLFEHLENKIWNYIKKISFLQPEVVYLEHLITSQEVKPYPEKFNTILKYTLPTDSYSIRQFIGFVIVTDHLFKTLEKSIYV